MTEQSNLSKTILASPRLLSIVILSALARLPLSMVSIVLLTGLLSSDKGASRASIVVAAISAGAGLSGFIQGPAWDRRNQASLLLLLAMLSSICLAGVAVTLTQETWLSACLAGLYGLSRPHITTVVRSAWLYEFETQPAQAGQAVAMDISLGSLIAVVGSLAAGITIWLFGTSSSLLVIAGIALASQAFLAMILNKEKRSQARTSQTYAETLGSLLSSQPVIMLLVLAMVSAIASGAVTVLFAAGLQEQGHLDWLSPLLAVNILGVVAGGAWYSKTAKSPGAFLHRLLLAEAFGLSLYGVAFLISGVALWPTAFIAALFVAPLSASLHVLIEARANDHSRSAAFSILASAGFAGAAMGQFLFGLLAQPLGIAYAFFAAAGLMILCAVVWMTLPYGMRRYRLQRPISWWPEDLLDRCYKLEQLAQPQQEEELQKLLGFVRSSLEDGDVPMLPRSIRALSQGDMPPSVSRLAYLAWEEAWRHSGAPDLSEAVVCAQWLYDSGLSEPEVLELAGTFGFIYRSYIEDTEHLPEEFLQAELPEQVFAVQLHASKLRSSRRYTTLLAWCDDPRLDERIRRGGRIRSTRLQAQWINNKPGDFDVFWELWHEAAAGPMAGDVPLRGHLLDALNYTQPFSGQGELLERLAGEYLESRKPSAPSIVAYYQARGLRIQGNLVEALNKLAQAYEILPMYEGSGYSEVFVEQFDAERRSILEQMRASNLDA